MYNKMPIGYGIVQSKVMLDPTISIKAKAVYSLLCSMTGSKQYCFPSTKKISESLGISEVLVYACIKELVNKNLLIVSKLYNDFRNNHKYEVLFYPDEQAMPSAENPQVQPIENSQYQPAENPQVLPAEKPHLINNNNINNNKEEGNVCDSSSIDSKKSENSHTPDGLFPIITFLSEQQKITCILRMATEKEKEQSIVLYRQLDRKKEYILELIKYYFENWRDIWFACTDYTRKLSKEKRKYNFNFGSLHANIVQVEEMYKQRNVLKKAIDIDSLIGDGAK